MEEDRRSIRSGLIIVRLFEDADIFCEEVALNIVVLSNFDIGDSVKDGVSLCRLILDLNSHSTW